MLSVSETSHKVYTISNNFCLSKKRLDSERYYFMLIFVEKFITMKKRYIALLRGINVSGQKSVKMDALKSALSDLSFEDVRTYIQSGNIVFDAAVQPFSEIEKQIETCILEKFGFEVPVMVLDESMWEKWVAENPFLEIAEDIKHLHVTILGDEPDLERVKILDEAAFLPDRFQILGRVVYLYCPGGYGNTKLSNSFFENKLKKRATTRNWKTTLELGRMMRE